MLDTYSADRGSDDRACKGIVRFQTFQEEDLGLLCVYPDKKQVCAMRHQYHKPECRRLVLQP